MYIYIYTYYTYICWEAIGCEQMGSPPMGSLQKVTNGLGEAVRPGTSAKYVYYYYYYCYYYYYYYYFGK